MAALTSLAQNASVNVVLQEWSDKMLYYLQHFSSNFRTVQAVSNFPIRFAAWGIDIIDRRNYELFFDMANKILF